VNGHDAVSVGELREDLSALSKIPAVADRANGEAPGTISSTFGADVLRTFLSNELLRQEAERRGIEVSQAELDEASATIAERWETSRESKFADLPDHLQGELVDAMVLSEKLEPVLGDLTDDDMQKAYDENIKSFTEVCVSHILVPTRVEAEAVKAELDKGRAFADVAKEKGTDGNEGRVASCAPPRVSACASRARRPASRRPPTPSRRLRP
jgi:parvulin-like peptidyl-prolyl isomerase